MTGSQLTQFLNVALQAANAARELILSYYNSDIEIEIKADLTPVTEADRQAEKRKSAIPP